MPPEPQERKRLSRLWPAALIAAAGLAAYANSLTAPLTFDDGASITDNPSIRHLLPLGSALSGPARAGTGGRPLLNLSFALNYAAGGLDVGGYHAANLAIHLLAGLVLFGIMRRTLEGCRAPPAPGSPGGDPPGSATALAFATALLWTLHPLQTESVTYVSQRAESLMGLFYLLTLYFFIRYAEGGRTRYAALSAAACLLGMATKEVMVTAPVVVLLYDRTFVAGTFAGALRRRRLYYAALAAPWLLLAFLLGSVRERGVGLGLGGAPWWAYALMESRVVVRYLGLAAWPHPLVLDYGRGVARPSWAAAPCAAALLSLVAGSVFALSRPAATGRVARAAGFAVLCAFLVLAPTSSVVAVSGQPMAEHRMYLPLAAVAALAVLGLHRLAGRRLLAWVAALAAVLGCLTWRRNEVYRSAEGLWRETVAEVPSNARAHYNLGCTLQALPGRLDDAVAEYEEALRLRPAYPEAHDNLGTALEQLPGRAGEAAAQYGEALRLDPGSAEAHYDLGSALSRIPGRGDEAMREYNEALRLRPDYAKAHNNLGTVLEQMPGRLEQAVVEYQEAIRVQPDLAEAHFNLGCALAKMGVVGEAAAEFRSALRLRPGYAKAHNNLGSALSKMPGHLQEAVAEFREALRLSPDYAEAHFNLGNALVNEPGGLGEAAAEYEEALRLSPGTLAFHFNLALTLMRIPGRGSEAAAQFKEVLRIQPGNDLARRLLDRIGTQGP